MKSRNRIAVLISLMLAMPAAVVAIEQAAPDYSPEAAEPPAAIAETAELAAEPAEPVAQAATEGGAAVTSISGLVGLVRVQPSDTFPTGSQPESEWVMLPPLVAYLERVEQQRSHLVARGDAFPMGDSDTEWHLLPAQVAYFERLEQQRVASVQPAALDDAAPAVAEAPSRNPLRAAMDYVTGIFKPGSAAQ